MTTEFERDTAVEALGGGRYAARCEERWFAPRGPNGGYLAAIVVRAMQHAVAEPARAPRSLTLHYLRPPAAGPLEVAVGVERAGRRVSTLTARVQQAGRLCVLAVGALAVDFEGVADYADTPPDVPRPPELFRSPEGSKVPPIARRFKLLPSVGPMPFSGGDEALSGGWIDFDDGPQTIDTPALALLTDAWLPAPFTRLTEPVGAPTIDLTIHFRAPEAVTAGPVLTIFRSRMSHDGFFEEDGEIWSADGVLLAQSRQLALLTR